MKKLLTILFVAVITLTNANSDSTKVMKKETAEKKFPVQTMTRFIIKAAPLAILNGYDGPSARIGIEYKLNNEWNLYNEAGYFFIHTGALAKVEFKKYLSGMYADSKFMSSREYVSFEFFYKRQEYRTGDSIYVANGPNYYKDFNVKKSVECFTIKYGNLFVYKGGLTVDFFIGAGIRFRQGCNTLSEEENYNIKSSSDYGPNIFTNFGCRSVFPNVDIGVKIGFGVK